MTSDLALAPLRRRGLIAIRAFLAVNLLAIAPVGLVLHNPDWWLVLLLALTVVAIPARDLRLGRFDARARLSAGVAMTCFPVLYVFLFKGDPWQMDTHMYFFVCFTMMVMLCDPRPILLGAGLTVVHHLLFFLLVPDWVFPGSGSLSRVLFHGFLVGCQVAILLTAVKQVAELTVHLQAVRQEADQARREAEREHESADRARADAVAALATSRAAEARAEREYRERLAAEAALKAVSDDRRLATADAIEASIGCLLDDLRTVADQFSAQAGDNQSVSQILSQEAGELRRSSTKAHESITDMARNTEELATSIRQVRDNAQQAHQVATTTADSIATLGPGIQRLSDEVDAANSILQMVSEIASQSNLLALNATIEAARSGEAGRGFAVVAAEMKQMAVATARAAAEISAKLRGIVAAADQFRGRIEDATGRVSAITGSSSNIASTVSQQQSATEAIARGAEVVLAQVRDTDSHSLELSEVAQRNQAIAERSSDLAEQLGRRARALSERMDDLLAQLRAA